MSKIIYDLGGGIERRGTNVKRYDPSLYPGGVFPFWIADTDFPGPVETIEVSRERVEVNHYGYPYIDPAFGEGIVGWYKVRHSTVLDPEYIDLPPCVIPAMTQFAEELSSAGDKILLQASAYPPSHNLVKNNGRQLAYNEMDLVSGRYEVNLGDLEKELSDPKAKVLSICSPRDPTGRCFTRGELAGMGEMCIRGHVMIGVDEIHGDIIFDGHTFIPLCGILEEFTDHPVAFINPARTFNVVDFRIAAWFTHNKGIYRETMNQQTYKKGMGRDAFGNAALMVRYNHGDDYADQCVAYLSETKNQAVAYINESIPRIKAIESEATLTIWMGCRGFGLQPQKELKDPMFRDTKVLLNNGTTSGEKERKGFVRLNFAAPRAVVMEGLKRIREAANRL